MNASDPTVPMTIHPDLAWRVIDDEVVILKIATTTYYSLNPVGSLLWRELDKGPRTRAELLERVLSEYDVDRATAEKDLDELIGDLRQEELLVENAA